jgi:GntR family transcriptional regulator, transcriptional repressor for pyruvate dehydrogenase complex
MLTTMHKPLSMQPVTRLSAPLAAIEQLRVLIQNGTLKPGDRLPTERQLAEMLGVSRPTVREALSALTLLNVVESRQGSGRVVRSLDLSAMAAPLQVLLSLSLPSDRDVESVLQVRAVIESGLARMAAERIGDDALADYRRTLDKLHAAGSVEEMLRHDIRLHGMIARESQSPMLTWLLESLRELIALARAQTMRVAAVTDSVASDQERIYDALARHDPSAAADAMWAHLARIEAAFGARDGEPDENSQSDDG